MGTPIDKDPRSLKGVDPSGIISTQEKQTNQEVGSDCQIPTCPQGPLDTQWGLVFRGIVEETSQSGTCKCSLSSKILGCLVPFKGTGVDCGSIKQAA